MPRSILTLSCRVTRVKYAAIPKCYGRGMRAALLCLACAALPACTANDDIPAPVASTVVPDHGAPGAVVEVTGSHFCQLPDNGDEDPTCSTTGDVVFGETPATPTTWADDAIQVEVPSGAPGATTLAVEVAGRTSNQLTFTID